MKNGQVRQVISDKGVTTYKQIGDSTFVSHKSSSIGVSGLFRIVFILILAIAIMRVAIGSNNLLTFTGFLDMLRNAPSIDTSWLKSFVYWGDSLASIPFIGSGLAFLSKIVSVALFGASGIIQIAIYAVYFMRFIFV